MKHYPDLTKEQFIEFLQLDINTPLQMLNLLKFKDKLQNGTTGEQQYKLYMKAALPFFKQSKANIVFYGEPKFTLIGPANTLEWDKVLIVNYPNKSDFVNMITTDGYPADLRAAALEDARLIFCEAIDF